MVEALGALVVVVLSPLPALRQRVSRCVAPQGHLVVGAETIEQARSRRIRPDVVAIDGQLLARCGWRGREVVEMLSPDRPVPLLGLVRRDDHRPPRELDLTRAGIVALYEPFQAAELSLVVNWLGWRGRQAFGHQ
jgi:hypothetical protein